MSMDDLAKWGEFAVPGERRNRIVREILAERERQDAQWGGPSHDDEHIAEDWTNYIRKQNNLSALRYGDDAPDFRERMIKIAALAMAAVESHDRRNRA